MPIIAGLLASGLTGSQSDKAGFKNSSSLLLGAKHSTLASSKPSSTHAQLSSSSELLHHLPAAGSLASTSGSGNWGTCRSTSGALHLGSNSCEGATTVKCTPAAHNKSSGGFIKSHVTITRFDSIGTSTLTGSGAGAAAAGRRSTSVPRSSHVASFDAAHAPCSSTSTGMVSTAGAKSTGATIARSSSTGRTTRSPSSTSPAARVTGAAAQTATGCSMQPTRTGGVSSVNSVGRIAVPGRARVTLGQQVPTRNLTDSSTRPGQASGVSGGSSSSSSVASARHVYAASGGVHSGRAHSSKDNAAVASLASSKQAIPGPSGSSMYRSGSLGSGGLPASNRQQHQQQQQQPGEVPGRCPSSSHPLDDHTGACSSSTTAAAAGAGTTGSTTYSSVQGSSYLTRLHQQRASTADAVPRATNSATGASSMAAVAGRRISSAGPGVTSSSSSSRQEALDVLRANRMRVRAPDACEAPAAAGLHASAPGTHDSPAPASAHASSIRSRDVQATPAAARTRSVNTSSSSSRAGIQAQESDQAADNLDSGVAALTALLERLNSKKRELTAAAGTERQRHQRQDHHPDQQEQQQRHDARGQQNNASTMRQQQPVYQQQQQQSLGSTASSVPGRRVTLPDSGPGERLDFPTLQQDHQQQQQQQQVPVPRSKSGSYLDIIRGKSTSQPQQILQQQQQQPQQPQQQRQQQQPQRHQGQQEQQPLEQHYVQSVTQLQPPHQQEQYRPSASGSSEGGSSTRIYRPIYTPPTSGGGARDQGSSSSWAPSDAVAAVTGVAAGVLRQQSGSSRGPAGLDAVHPTADWSSGGGSAHQQHTAGRQQQQQQESASAYDSRAMHDTVHSSSTQQEPGFLISTSLLPEHSYDTETRQQDGSWTSSSTGDAPTAAAGAADQAAAAAAAARREFLRCSTSSKASDDQEPAAAATAKTGAALSKSSSIQRGTSWRPQQQQQQPIQQQQRQSDVDWIHTMAQGPALVSSAGTGSHSRPQQQVHGHRVPLPDARAGDDSDSESDVSEMSCTSGSSSGSSVDIPVQIRSRAAAAAAALPEYPSPSSRSSTAAQQALFGADSSSNTRRLAGPVSMSPEAAAAPASPGQVPVKAYARSLSSRGVGLPRGCCGIRNQGNTCYQNTAVQLLCCVPELVGALLGQQAVQLLCAAAADATNNRSKASVQRALLVAAAAAQAGIAWLPKASVGPALQQLVREMWGFQELQERSQGSSPVRKQVAQRPQAQLQEQQQQLQRVTACMTALREAMAEVDPRWDDGDQWDCQEFALTLLQMVHSESNRVRGRPQYCELKLQGSEAQQAAQAAAYAKSWDDSVVLDIFSWQLQNTMTCCACGKHSHTFDSSQELLVAIPPGSDHVTVQECLARTIFSPEQMVGEEGYKCESCKALREATKQLQLFTYPQVLLLGLKRFETRGGSKGGSRVSEAYMSRKVSTRVWLDARELLDLTPFCNPAGLQAAAAAGRPPPRYELIAVADHSGGLNGGHYTARGRCVVDGSWAEFNDSLVLGADAPSGSTSAAYMMLYRLAC